VESAIATRDSKFNTLWCNTKLWENKQPKSFTERRDVPLLTLVLVKSAIALTQGRMNIVKNVDHRKYHVVICVYSGKMLMYINVDTAYIKQYLPNNICIEILISRNSSSICSGNGECACGKCICGNQKVCY
jgi:hypothetical protein